MSYRTLVKNQVDAAFKRVGDLALDVILTTNTKSDYDFATDTSTDTVDSTLVVKAIKKSEKPGKDALSNMIVAELLMKSADIANPDIYDTVTIAGVPWKVVPPYKDNDYTINVTVVRAS